MRFTPRVKYDIDELEKMISKGEGVQLDFKQGITCLLYTSDAADE